MTPCSEAKVKADTSSAYILFYRRRGLSWPTPHLSVPDPTPATPISDPSSMKKSHGMDLSPNNPHHPPPAVSDALDRLSSASPLSYPPPTSGYETLFIIYPENCRKFPELKNIIEELETNVNVCRFNSISSDKERMAAFKQNNFTTTKVDLKIHPFMVKLYRDNQAVLKKLSKTVQSTVHCIINLLSICLILLNIQGNRFIQSFRNTCLV